MQHCPAIDTTAANEYMDLLSNTKATRRSAQCDDKTFIAQGFSIAANDSFMV